MRVCAGIDVGSGVVKGVVMAVEEDEERLISYVAMRIRKRAVDAVIDDVFHRTVDQAGMARLDYVATTGEGEEVPYATGHFYGMTTHARGGLFLEPQARAIVDIGALHARAVKMDPRGKVLDYKMTSQCASGSGQFLENIVRYLGVSLSEAGQLSLEAENPDWVSSICAVLAETDVINMVSRGITTPDILRGIHESMAGRLARLLRSVRSEGVVLLTGGLAGDVGLRGALVDALAADKRRKGGPLEIRSDPMSIYAGAIGAAIWGGFRHARTSMEGPAWVKNGARTVFSSL